MSDFRITRKRLAVLNRFADFRLRRALAALHGVLRQTRRPYVAPQNTALVRGAGSRAMDSAKDTAIGSQVAGDRALLWPQGWGARNGAPRFARRWHPVTRLSGRRARSGSASAARGYGEISP